MGMTIVTNGDELRQTGHVEYQPGPLAHSQIRRTSSPVWGTKEVGTLVEHYTRDRGVISAEVAQRGSVEDYGWGRVLKAPETSSLDQSANENDCVVKLLVGNVFFV